MFLAVLLLIICIVVSITAINKPNLVIVTSVIHTHKSPLSYGTRSVLTARQRFEQTLYTLMSVRTYVPNAYILLVEGSNITPEEEAAFISYGCNRVVNCSRELESFINGPHKTLAEIHMLLFALKTIKPERYSTISKISGRYYLTSNFKWYKYPQQKALYQCEPNGRCNTRYYRIPSKYFKIYKSTLESALRDEDVAKGSKDIEAFNIFKEMPESNKLVQGEQVLGVRGYVAPWGVEVEDFSMKN